MTDSPLLERLATYRLEHDLTFVQLAAQMKAAGYPLRPRSLHLLLTRRVRTAPHDRTLYKIERFLDRPRVSAKRSRRSEGTLA